MAALLESTSAKSDLENMQKDSTSGPDGHSALLVQGVETRDGDAVDDEREPSDHEKSVEFHPEVDVYDLDKKLNDFVGDICLTPVDRVMHEHITDLLVALASRYIHRSAQVSVFGSAASGLGERGCDLDATIVVPGWQLERRFGSTKPEFDMGPNPACARAVKAIGQGVTSPTEGWMEKGIRVENVITTAKIPICVLSTEAGYTCDLSINNELPVYNTKLLQSYATLDSRVKSLILAVKHWAKVCHVCDAKVGHLSSYSWTLLCIYYLQVRPEGALVPSLQWIAESEPSTYFDPSKKQEYNVAFAPDDDERTQAAVAHLRVNLTSAGKSEPTLNDLLRGFFRFYHEEYDWGSECISIRTGRRLSIDHDEYYRLGKKDRRGGNFLHIEDPFDLERNLNCVLHYECAKELRHSMKMFAEQANVDWGSVVAMLADSGKRVKDIFDEQMRYLTQLPMWRMGMAGRLGGARGASWNVQSMMQGVSEFGEGKRQEQSQGENKQDPMAAVVSMIENFSIPKLLELLKSLQNKGMPTEKISKKVREILLAKIKVNGIDPELSRILKSRLMGNQVEPSAEGGLAEGSYESGGVTANSDTRNRVSQSPDDPPRGFYMQREETTDWVRIDCW